jgi:hypothetical protein
MFKAEAAMLYMNALDSLDSLDSLSCMTGNESELRKLICREKGTW